MIWGKVYLSKGAAMHHILIIDDSEFDRRMITLAMQSTGLNLDFTELSNGSDVLDTMSKLEPTVTFLDIRMPGKSGFEILSEIKSAKNLNNCPVVLVSGSDAQCDRTKASEMGASGYFKKPHTRQDYKDIANNIKQQFMREAA